MLWSIKSRVSSTPIPFLCANFKGSWKTETCLLRWHSCFRPADFYPRLPTYLGGRSWTGPWVPWPSALGWGPCRSCPGWGWPLAAGGGQSRSGPASPWSCCTLMTSHTWRTKQVLWKNTGQVIQFTTSFCFWNMSGCLYKGNLSSWPWNTAWFVIRNQQQRATLTHSHVHKTKDCSLLPIQITHVGEQVVLWAVTLGKKRGITPGSQTHKQLSAEPQPKFCWFNHLWNQPTVTYILSRNSSLNNKHMEIHLTAFQLYTVTVFKMSHTHTAAWRQHYLTPLHCISDILKNKFVGEWIL